MARALSQKQVQLSIDGVDLQVSALSRQGGNPPIVFLHGFGSTKEDYADIQLYESFDDHAILAYDAPGCGQTHCSNPEKVSIDFLVKTALAMLEAEGVERFHLARIIHHSELPNRLIH